MAEDGEKEAVCWYGTAELAPQSSIQMGTQDKMQQVINAGTLTPLQKIITKHGIELMGIAGDALIMHINIAG